VSNKLKDILKSGKFNWLLVSVIFLATLLRVWQISEIFEQGELHETFGIEILRMGVVNYLKNELLYRYAGPISPLLTVPFFYLLGQNIIALKLPYIICGILSILFLYLFTRDFYNIEIALLGSFLLAIFPPHVYLSTLPLQYIFTPFFVTTTLYLFHKYYKTNRSCYLYCGGAISGLGILVRLSFLFFLIPFVLLTITFKHSYIKKHLKKILISFLFFIAIYSLFFLNLSEYLTDVKNKIKYFISLPVTDKGEDLRDVIGNLQNGLVNRFAINFLKEHKYVRGEFKYVSPGVVNFLNIFLVALITFILLRIWSFYLPIHYLSPITHLTFKKDIFILILLLCILILTSTITGPSEFHIEEFVITTPFITIIIAKAVYEIIKIGEKLHTNLPFIIFFVFFLAIIFASYPFLNNFLNRSPDACVRYLPLLVKAINQMNYSLIVGEHQGFNDALNWYGLRPTIPLFGMSKGSLIIRSEADILIKSSNNQRTLYLFQPSSCRLRPDVIEKFEEEVIKNNKSVILKKNLTYEIVNYTIYEIT
jgi:hypothetical protein